MTRKSDMDADVIDKSESDNGLVDCHNGKPAAEETHTMEEENHSSNTSKRRLKKTLVHFSLIFFFTFTPYGALEVFQSSLNFEKGLGTFSLSLLYSTYALSSLLIGPTVVTLLKPKWILFMSLFTHTVFIIANVFPGWATMLTASAVLGVASPLIWITQGTYVNNLALNYSEISKEKLELILSKFIGAFFAISGMAGPLGTLISSVVLGRTLTYNITCTSDHSSYKIDSNIYMNLSHIYTGDKNNSYVLTDNLTGQNKSSDCSKNIDVCGPHHCPYMEEHLEVLEKPEDLLIYILMSVFLLFNITGIILCLFLPNITAPKKVFIKEKLRSTIKVMKVLNMWLLLPIFYFNGVIAATIYSSFTQSFISCTFGVAMVGYVMMAEAIAYCVSTLLSGPITKYVTRCVQITVSAVSVIVLGISWLLWKPELGDLWVTVVMVIIHGLARGSLEIQINALTCFLFPDDPEAAFGQMHVWQSVGYIVVFAYSSLLCFNIKIYSLIATTAVMVVCNFIIEIRLKSNKKGVTEEVKVEEVPIKTIEDS